MNVAGSSKTSPQENGAHLTRMSFSTGSPRMSCHSSVELMEPVRPRTDSTIKLKRDLSTYPPELVALAKNRVQYLKEIDRRQPISITEKTMGPLIRVGIGEDQ